MLPAEGGWFTIIPLLSDSPRPQLQLPLPVDCYLLLRPYCICLNIAFVLHLCSCSRHLPAAASSLKFSSSFLWDANLILLFFGFCCCSIAQSCPTLCDPMDCSTPGSPVLHYLPKLAQTHVHESVMPFNHLIPCHLLLLLPSIFASIRVFSNESALHIRWPKYWSFSFSISPSNEYWMNIQGWFPLGLTGGISLQSKGLSRVFSSTTVWKHQFFCVQSFLWSNSHPYMTTGKTIALTIIWTFVG